MCLLKSGRCSAVRVKVLCGSGRGREQKRDSDQDGGKRIKVLEGRDGAGSKRETQIRAERGG